MHALHLSATSSEEEFAGYVDAIAAAPGCRGRLLDLLREDHPVYDQRGGATVSRMRGWVLVALARGPVSDAALPFLLEELDTGVDPYLVAAAARALRSYPHPRPALAPFVMRALEQIRYRDDPVSFDEYGAYATSTSATGPVREILETLAWLGPHARGVLAKLQSVARSRGLAKQATAAADRALDAIHTAIGNESVDTDSCCELPRSVISACSWPRTDRRDANAIESLPFEDHDGTAVTFEAVFRGHPTIVVFFYTRCDNPLKCSLTVTKLARVQRLLAERGLADRIHTAAITYDPGFDSAKRLAAYGRDRAVRMDGRHRMLRATADVNALRAHFRLGVNFIESLVNRHRVEAYVLDAQGRLAASFERLLWDESAIVERAYELLTESTEDIHAAGPRADDRALPPRSDSPAVGVLASAGVAFFPKCAVCWATYVSMFGVAGLERIPFPAWLEPVLAIVMAINLAFAWLRGWATGRMHGPLLVSAGAAAILASRAAPAWERLGLSGVGLVLVGSMMCAVDSRRRGAERVLATHPGWIDRTRQKAGLRVTPVSLNRLAGSWNLAISCLTTSVRRSTRRRSAAGEAR